MAHQVRARSGHILTVADAATADRWVARGYVKVEAAKPKPDPKPAAKSADKK